MEKVLIGMSGGVDSSVSAYLLKEQGYEVIGATMVLYDADNKEGCLSVSASEDASLVCQKLGIAHYVIDLKKEFKEYVIDNFITNYKEGKTPNPCVVCNKNLKFGFLWKKAQELGCTYIATGHYAQIKDGNLCKIDSSKDQSYFLYQINKEVLPHILFPLSKYKEKEDVRSIARQIGLWVAEKKDSQDICFIPNNQYTHFLEKVLEHLPEQGNIVTESGEILGTHKGLMYYTVGQRKGLNIAYKHPLYVIEIDKKNNQLLVGKEEQLYHKEICIENCNLLVEQLPKKALGKCRYRAQLTPCKIEKIGNNELKIIFDTPIKSPTKGQSLVLYQEDIVLGGGIIKDILL